MREIFKIDISEIEKYQKNAPEKRTAFRLTSVEKLFSREIKLFSSSFNAKQKEAFYSELGLLLSTGVDLKIALDIIEEDNKNDLLKKTVASIKQDIIGGKRVYESLQGRGSSFTNYEIQSVKIGEETGRLAAVCHELGSYFNSVVKLKRQIMGVATYPIVVIFLAVCVVYFMLSFVVPVFSDIFIQTGRKLPALTIFLINVSAYSNIIMMCILSVCFTGYFVHKSQSKREWYRKFTSGLVLRIPIVRDLVRKIYLARFCQSMKMLSGAKVIVNESLDLVANMIGYYPIEVALADVKNQVVFQGKLLNESLSKHAIFPKKLVSLIKLSEEVNKPEVIYERLFNQYSAEIDHQQAIIGKLIEPLFIVILGIFVGFILVAMYMPMFELSSTSFN